MDLDALLLEGTDSSPVVKILQEAGVPCRRFADVDGLIDALKSDGGVLIIPRLLNSSERARLQSALDEQPGWSDWPIIFAGIAGEDAPATDSPEALGNVLCLPAPLSRDALLSAVRKGLRERSRQCRFRDALEGLPGRGGRGDAMSAVQAAVEAQVLVRTEEMQRTIKALEAFSYTVAHDLRAPLRAMQGLSTALVEDYADALDGDGKDYAHRIVAAAARMDHLVQDLLAYARLERMDIGLARVELEAIVDTVLMGMTKEIKGVNAELQVRRPLPVVWSHPVVLEQVITHLFGNALKFVAAGVRPQIEVRAEEVGQNVRLWVVDNGIGIEPRHHEKIFNVFERLHGEETYPGTGIGLALVRKGMLRVRGSSGLESQTGRGSRFWIELPKKAPAS